MVFLVAWTTTASLAPWRLRRIREIEISSVSRTKSGYFDQHRVGVSAGEVICATRFRVHTAGRKVFERLFIEAVAVTKLPGARYDSGHPIVTMRMRWDRRVGRHEQHKGVEAGF